jgi:hypothetical protein
MDNISGKGLADGFMNGFQFMDNHYARKEARGRADERFDREKEGWEREDNGRLIQAFQTGVKTGNIDPKIAGEFGKRFDVEWSNYTDPQFGGALEVLEQTVQGNYSMKSPEFKDAFGRVFRKEIQKNTGEATDGGVIKEKRLRGVYPSPDGQGIMVDLEVFEEGPGGGSWRNAPVTEGRSAKDDSVKMVPLSEALKQLKGHRLLFNGIQKSPELMSFIKQQAALNGTSLPEEQPHYGEITDHPELGTIQRGPNGKVNVLKGLETPEGRYSAPYNHPELGLVQEGPNGKITPYKTEGSGEGYGEVINHPELGLVQQGPNGKYVQFKSPKDGAGSGGGLDSSVMSQVQQTAKNFHGQFNPDGSYLGLPDKAGKKYALAMERTEELIAWGMPVFAAANLANLSVIDPLTSEAATQIAEREAEEKGLSWGDKDKFVKQHAKELLIKQNEAIEIYKQFKAGRSDAPAQGLKMNTPNTNGPVTQAQDLPIPQVKAPEVPPSQTGVVQRAPEPIPASEASIRTAAPADIKKLKVLISNERDPKRIETIKKYYIKNFGQLPAGI